MSEKVETFGAKSISVVAQSENVFNAGITLTESNYDVWSQLMEMHIAEREKLSYIRGKKASPVEFENGLDEAFEQVRGEILCKDLIPDLEECYALARREAVHQTTLKGEYDISDISAMWNKNREQRKKDYKKTPSEAVADVAEKASALIAATDNAFALDTGGLSGNGGQESLNGDSPDLGGTRLSRIVIAGGRQLLEKLNMARKNFPMKIFLLLLGFYTANALATILGQTGDWDVLVAGVVVAAIEGIGMLMYRKPTTMSTGRLKSFVVMMNYWKAGVCLGLFVDAFKLGS
ncbi:hypothetical protein JRO89_XS04G0016000 [Xanthoceras sorbifolium]|uniref:Ycf20-like protein n=1 Tax=Xanthoceras sorbifolium TaxID=99658 RepID=A0ABQ8I3R9_9ROSI|nr:hypothetical protein JRO89_XS04G0016000 [Xanthoceras sorbifolium]